ncbi:MAG: serine hydrolase domain-containing protein [Planctomycetota bacterium]
MICSLLMAPQEPVSQEPAPQPLADLHDTLAKLRTEHDVPALGCAVLVDGQLVALGTAGVRKHGDDTAVTDDDLWHLGSCTKAMTATLLARDVEAGRLAWTTTLGDALPDLRDGMHEDARAIPLAQLLQHRAGLPSQPPDALWRELFAFEGGDRAARTEVATVMLAKAPEAAPGVRFLYSNASYMIAGAVAERVTVDGEVHEWQQRMRDELFAPLGMQSAGFGPPGDREHVTQPWGHRKAPRGMQPVFGDNPSSLGPAGTVHCSLRDWAKFVALHLGVVPTDGEPLLNTASLAALHRPPTEPKGADYALGWGVHRRAWAPGPILSHSGSNTMWFCVAWLAPEAKFAVLVTCNQGDADRACDAVAAAMIRRFRR